MRRFAIQKAAVLKSHGAREMGSHILMFIYCAYQKRSERRTKVEIYWLPTFLFLTLPRIAIYTKTSSAKRYAPISMPHAPDVQAAERTRHQAAAPVAAVAQVRALQLVRSPAVAAVPPLVDGSVASIAYSIQERLKRPPSL